MTDDNRKYDAVPASGSIAGYDIRIMHYELLIKRLTLRINNL